MYKRQLPNFIVWWYEYEPIRRRANLPRDKHVEVHGTAHVHLTFPESARHLYILCLGVSVVWSVLSKFKTKVNSTHGELWNP
mgnify:FL=1